MNSFYSTLYGKFADLQVDQSFSARFAYPAKGLRPSLKIGKGILDCTVRIPQIRAAKGTISYGPFLFKDSEFGQAAAIRLAVASTCLLSGKSVFYWLYRDYLGEWLASKEDKIRAGYIVNVILDMLARQRIRQVEGEDFYADTMRHADLLVSALLPRHPKNFGILTQATLASFLLNISAAYAPTAIVKTAKNFISKLNAFAFDPSRLVDIIRDRISSNNNTVEISRAESGWDHIAKLADTLYAIIDKIPGKWHSVYLPYSNVLAVGNLESISIFESKIITEKEFTVIKRRAMNGSSNNNHAGDDTVWQEIFFELLREEKRNEKTLSRLSRATKNLNFSTVGFPTSDYVSYYSLYNELGPQIRRVIERVSLIKNALDENAFEESGSIDLQVAIQAVASETRRNDIFIKDENLLKNESWTILIDSSLSLSGSSRQLKAVSICLGETANQVMGSSNPWAMFAFSDEFYCIKDFTEPYDSQVKARIGGLAQNGLSHIPDAIRSCRALIGEHSKDRNYLILVSDGIPSGYLGIEAEFTASVKELGKYGINLAAIGMGGSAIKKAIRNARTIDTPADIVKEFIEIYQNLSL
ncbi:hypothetical protein Ngar_c29280 [Candidatus Nitrososphaera gargensis Ga9.2]|uniref:von Willebrand factor type A n=1 Tax=Nitrososphaera gargensis (strain Ga9.2) TaxID=1237085 RepID=K0IER4_NITGG|nr:VWA domain-containing protein [Candidatus Nitrososphaera gargensis]AFU59846.1 hypothetical protein Ngar_c29280 [Candidatus Nitrososphaera gargensis Ga9.2]